MKALARFAAARTAQERCGLCGEALLERHAHLVEAASGRVLCACGGCAGVFDAVSGRFRRVPDRVVRLPDLVPDRAALGVPVGVAFFRRRSTSGAVVAVYPSPLGPVESAVEPAAWDALVLQEARLVGLAGGVEALLLGRDEAFLAPIDACYGLIGLIRREWRGIGGGDGATTAVERFFAELRARSEVAP